MKRIKHLVECTSLGNDIDDKNNIRNNIFLHISFQYIKNKELRKVKYNETITEHNNSNDNSNNIDSGSNTDDNSNNKIQKSKINRYLSPKEALSLRNLSIWALSKLYLKLGLGKCQAMSVYTVPEQTMSLAMPL